MSFRAEREIFPTLSCQAAVELKTPPNRLVSPNDFDYKEYDRSERLLETHLEHKPQPISPTADDDENWWDFCPLCNTRLVNQKCKYICPSPKCNFFMSCSEFDL